MKPLSQNHLTENLFRVFKKVRVNADATKTARIEAIATSGVGGEMAWTVHHYFPCGSGNVGDALVAYALQQALSRHFGRLEFVNLPVNERAKIHADFGLRGAQLDRTNAEADLVLIGGSNLLEPRNLSQRQQLQKTWHWGVCTDCESIHRLEPQLMLLGMGTGSDWAQRILPYSSRAAGEISLLHQKAFASAVRDEPTAQHLARLGIRTDCTGCPVTFLTARPVTAQTAAGPLIVSLPPARILKRWSGRLFMRQTMGYLRWLQQQDVPFVVTLHERADLDFAPAWLPSGITPFYTENVQELIQRYEASCGVIGFRLHAALLGLGLGKPIVPVSVDWRGRAFVQTFGLEDLALEPLSWGGMQRLRRGTLALLQGDASLSQRLNFQKQRLARRFEAFLHHAAGQFHQHQRQTRRAVA
jgi:hypothetical protein